VFGVYWREVQIRPRLLNIDDHEKRTPTFKEIASEWHRHKKPNLRATTWEMYEIHIRLHFIDIEHVRINTITTATVEKWIAKRQAEGMSLGMLRKLLVTFNQIMAYSVRHRLIDYNVYRIISIQL